MDTKIILSKIDAYKKAIEKIGANRSLWNTTTKQLIYDTLQKVKSLADLDWQVQRVEGLTNLEAVNICFNQRASMLIEADENGRRNNTKHGGALIFAQAYNGQIFVIYIYPYIDNWVSQLDNKCLEKIEPENISESFILTHVEKFLDEMTKWESSTSRTKIGFITE